MTSEGPIRQAPEGLRMRAIIAVAIGSTVVFVIGVLVAWWMTPSQLRRPEPQIYEPRALVAGVEQDSFRDPARSERMRAEERARLQRYAWVDGGVARIPVLRAMELTERGCRPPGAGQAAVVPASGAACDEVP